VRKGYRGLSSATVAFLTESLGLVLCQEYSGVVVCFGHASITVTLERHSHWIPSVGRHSADGMDEALG
jgi:hypothetical protein